MLDSGAGVARESLLLVRNTTFQEYLLHYAASDYKIAVYSRMFNSIFGFKFISFSLRYFVEDNIEILGLAFSVIHMIH